MSVVYPWFTNTFTSLLGRHLAGRLHHGLLFIGPDGIGKFDFSISLAKAILCQNISSVGACGQCQSCLLFDANTHADFHLLESEKQLGVDKIRGAIATLNGTAQLGGNKVLIIPKADSMTESASNALLKTLEEPTAKTFLILLSAYPAKLLPTILSRCSKETLALPSPEVAISWLKEQGIEDASDALLQAYSGAPLSVKSALMSDNSFSYREFVDQFSALLAGNKTPRELALKWQDNAQQVVTWCQREAHDRYRVRQRSNDYDVYALTIEIQQTLQHPGVNKVLLLNQVLSACKSIN